VNRLLPPYLLTNLENPCWLSPERILVLVNQKGDKYGIANHKNSIAKYDVTSTPLQGQRNNTTIIGGNVVDEIAKLKQQPGKDILIERSATLVAALAQAGLIDEYNLLVHPVIVGSGKRFFRERMGMTGLKLVESKPISLGIVLLTYEAARRPSK
jgi:dihydrofolate reductase